MRHTDATKDKIRQAKLGAKNPHWAGDKVGYIGLHKWVRNRLPKPVLCPACKLRPAYDLANKGVYDRNLDNWEYLCRSCHMIKDGRLERLKNLTAESRAKVSQSLKGHPKFYKGDKFDRKTKTW